jgi:hypothetical protein
MSRHQLKISTIVRFSLIAIGLTGCAGAPRLESAARACNDGAPPLCSSFAAATPCTCVSRTELDRFLGGFGSAAWPGAID